MSAIFSRFKGRKQASVAVDNILTDTASSSSSDKNAQVPSVIQEKLPTSPDGAKDVDPDISVLPDAPEDSEDVDEDLKDYPAEVRNTVSFEDDQTLPTITFRYFVLTFVFTAPGAFLYQMV